MTLEWTTPWPATLALGIATVAAGLWIRRHYRLTRPEAPERTRRLLTGLRIAATVLLALAAAGPRLVRETRVERPARIAVVVEDSASMASADLPGDATRWSRATALAAAVDSLASGFEGGPLVEQWRGNGLRALRPLAPHEPPSEVGSGLEALLHGVVRAAPDVPRAVVLVSDGHETDATSPAAERVVAPLVVGVGDPIGPPDVWLDDLRAPESAFVGDEVVVEFTVGVRSGEEDPGEAVLATLWSGLAEVDRMTLEPTADDARLRGELKARVEEAGTLELSVLLETVAREATLENNGATAIVQVHKGRRRVLAVASRPGWLTRFLAASAAAEDRIDLVVVAPRADGSFGRADGGAWEAPRTVESWLEWDAVLLDGGPTGAVLPDVAPLAEAVERGLGLLLVDGGGSDPPALLATLRPVTPLPGPLRGEGRLGAVPGASGHPVLDGVDLDPSSLDRLPPLTSWRAARPDGDAAVLLEVRGGAAGGPDGGRPLLAASTRGDARTAWLGSSALWEQIFWRPPPGLGDDRRPLDRLVRNLLVWLAQGDEAAGTALLGLRSPYAEGEAIRIRARTRSLRGRAGVPPATLSVRPLQGDEQEPRLLTLTSEAGDVTVGSVVLPPLPSGRYRLQALDAEDAPLGESRDILVEPHSPERFQTDRDETRLRALAEAWDGVYLDASHPAVIDSLASRLGALSYAPAETVRTSARALASTWLYLLSICGCLGLEWFLRRRQGML